MRKMSSRGHLMLVSRVPVMRLGEYLSVSSSGMPFKYFQDN